MISTAHAEPAEGEAFSTSGDTVDIVVVGAGILGLTTARRLQRESPDARILVLEKEAEVARHQTAHNSGVVHAGVYYRPGSLKALLCRQGAQQLREYCVDRGIQYQECGKLIIAVRERELPELEAVYHRGTANGVPGLRRIASHEITEIEPHATGIAAIHSPATAIVDFPAVCRSLKAEITAAGGAVITGAEVTGFRHLGTAVEVSTTHARVGGVRCGQVIVAAGLQSDRLATLAGDAPAPRIVPFRGIYYRLHHDRTQLVKGLIYPVPDPRYPFLGIHLTRTVGGEVLVGPNAVLALDRAGYGRRLSARWRDVAAIASWPGAWSMARQHWKTGGIEMARSMSKRLFVREAGRYVPALTASDVQPAGDGIRAQAVGRAGNLLDDFVITQVRRVVNIRNAPSPAATSSFAIADYVVDHLRDVSG